MLTARVGHDCAYVVIAAAMLQHCLSAAALTERHFSPFSVSVFNPYECK
jgi:hypothetical protein